MASNKNRDWRENVVEEYAAHLEGERQIHQNVRELIPRDSTESALGTVRMNIDEIPLTVAQVYSRANRDQRSNPQMQSNELVGRLRGMAILRSSDPNQVKAIGETGILPEDSKVIGWVPITIAQVNRRDDMPTHYTDNTEEFPESFEQEIEVWKVIGWTEGEENPLTLLFRHSDFEILQPFFKYYTDSVFPVLGLPHVITVNDPNNTEEKWDIEDITPLLTIEPQTYFHYLILSQYRTGIHLVLVKTDVTEQEREVEIPERGVEKILSQSAKLMCFIPNQETNILYLLGRIERIFSIYSTNQFPNYSFIGLFSGEQFNENMFANENFPKLSKDLNENCLQWEYKHSGMRLFDRIGYLVSIDSLLDVCECPDPFLEYISNSINTTNTLLKECTYILIEGRDRLISNYNRDKEFRKTLRVVLQYSVSNIPYPPKIVVIGEGVNGIEIRWSQRPLVPSLLRFRNSRLYLNDPLGHPSVIDWQQFRQDFQNVLPIPEIEFRQIMPKNEINDYIEVIGYQIQRNDCHLILSLFQKPIVLQHSEVREYWHVYARIGQTDDYIYIMSIDVKSIIKSNRFQGRYLDIDKYYTSTLLQAFDDTISDPIYQTHDNQHWYRNLRKFFHHSHQRFNIGFMLLLKAVSAAKPHEFKNPGLYTEMRFILFDDLKVTHLKNPQPKFTIV